MDWAGMTEFAKVVGVPCVVLLALGYGIFRLARMFLAPIAEKLPAAIEGHNKLVDTLSNNSDITTASLLRSDTNHAKTHGALSFVIDAGEYAIEHLIVTGSEQVADEVRSRLQSARDKLK